MGIAKMAGGAFIREHHPGMIIPCIHRQHFGRTEFHADAATFAPGGIQDDLSTRAFFACANPCGTGERRCCGEGHWRLRRNGWHKKPFRLTGFGNGLFYYSKHSYKG
jgi:hypothetical protein